MKQSRKIVGLLLILLVAYMAIESVEASNTEQLESFSSKIVNFFRSTLNQDQIITGRSTNGYLKTYARCSDDLDCISGNCDRWDGYGGRCCAFPKPYECCKKSGLSSDCTKGFVCKNNLGGPRTDYSQPHYCKEGGTKKEGDSCEDNKECATGKCDWGLFVCVDPKRDACTTTAWCCNRKSKCNYDSKNPVWKCGDFRNGIGYCIKIQKSESKATVPKKTQAAPSKSPATNFKSSKLSTTGSKRIIIRKLSKGDNSLNLGLISAGSKTWYVDIQGAVRKVGIGVYTSNNKNVNMFGGWQGSLKVNGNTVWKVLWENKEAKVFVHALNNKVWEADHKSGFFDITGYVKMGKNVITYTHNTDGGHGPLITVHGGTVKKWTGESKSKPKVKQEQSTSKNKLELFPKQKIDASRIVKRTINRPQEKEPEKPKVEEKPRFIEVDGKQIQIKNIKKFEDSRIEQQIGEQKKAQDRLGISKEKESTGLMDAAKDVLITAVTGAAGKAGKIIQTGIDFLGAKEDIEDASKKVSESESVGDLAEKGLEFLAEQNGVTQAAYYSVQNIERDLELREEEAKLREMIIQKTNADKELNDCKDKVYEDCHWKWCAFNLGCYDEDFSSCKLSGFKNCEAKHGEHKFAIIPIDGKGTVVINKETGETTIFGDVDLEDIPNYV